MGIFDIEYSFDNLLRTSSSGIDVSTFVQMKEAITKRYKEIYGNDIDVDSTTADGQFIMMMSLMLFNGYSGLYYLSQNLDPASAQNAFLNRLCSFNNVFRKTASPSYVDMYVQYIGTSNNYVSNVGSDLVQEITCIDSDGNLWKWQEGKGTDGFSHKFSQFKKNGSGEPEIYTLRFTCEENGPIEAKADEEIRNKGNKAVSLTTEDETHILLDDDNHGTISKTLDLTVYPFKVWQAKDAIVGNDEESDVALRERRLMEIGNNGITVINGLSGSLLNVQGVKEVKVYSNSLHEKSSDNAFVANDGSKVQFHDVYICIKYEEGIEADNDEIGKTIYNKLTPGIVTAPVNKYFDSGNGNYVLPDKPSPDEAPQTVFGEYREYKINVYNNILEYKLYWKKCLPINPALKLEFFINNSVASYKDMQEVIKNAFLDYSSSLTIQDDLTIPNLLAYLNSCSPIISNQKAYIFTNGVVRKKITDEKWDTYFTKYDFSNEEITDSTSSEDLTTLFENCDTYFNYDDSTFDFSDSDEENPSEVYSTHTLNIYYTPSNEEENNENEEENNG